MSVNSGSTGILNADSCAGCHRIHSSKSPTGYLLTSADESVTDFCLTCHGSVGAGATTDVETGLQYALAGGASSTIDKTTGSPLGALRGGGFEEARIASSSAQRYRFTVSNSLDFLAKVPVGAASPVTSAHIAIGGAQVTSTGIAWGYGAPAASNPGTAFAGGLECTSCHNPHGNGQYRILRPLPKDSASSGGVSPSVAAPVYDPPLPSPGDTRNYTVIQTKGTTGTNSSFLLYASDVIKHGYAATSGDYFHRYVPWNSASGAQDAPNGRADPGFVGTAFVDDFNTQMTAWCTTCHTRYHNTRGPTRSTGDGIFTYQHLTNVGAAPACTTCHVAHGSNAVMNTDPAAGTTYSANTPYPDGQVHQVGDSRLLKIDNRGTCLACHDPTNTVPVGTYQGPTPNPVVP